MYFLLIPIINKNLLIRNSPSDEPFMTVMSHIVDLLHWWIKIMEDNVKVKYS